MKTYTKEQTEEMIMLALYEYVRYIDANVSGVSDEIHNRLYYIWMDDLSVKCEITEAALSGELAAESEKRRAELMKNVQIDPKIQEIFDRMSSNNQH